MKRKLLFFIVVATMLMCAFTISVFASGSTSDAYGDVITIEDQTPPSIIDSTSRVVILGSDGLYYTFPSYYILADNATFTWKQNTALNDIIGRSGTSASGLRSYIVRMEIPSGIAKLNPNSAGGGTVFEDAALLVEVKIPESVTILGDYCFNRCKKLTTIIGFEEYLSRATYISTLLLSQTAWGEGVDLVIPEGITVLKKYCFYGTKIKSISLPSTLETMEERAFGLCKSITSVTIPASVKYIKNHVFESCSNLASVDLSQCTSLEEIGEYCFEYSALTSFDFTPFASTLTKLGNGILNGCSKLTTVTGFENTIITSVPYKTFNGCPLSTLTFPPNATSIGNYAYFGHKSTQTVVKMPNSILSIGDHAFARNGQGGGENLKIYLPESLTTVADNYIFENWYFKEMYIPSSLTSITCGFVNKTLQTGVVYYFTGASNGFTINETHNDALLKATWIPYEEFNGASSTGNYIVYNYNKCLAFYDGAHILGDISLGNNVNYAEAINVISNCSRCAQNNLIVETIGAIFTDMGYSASETTFDMTHGYNISVENLEKLTAIFPNVKIGFLATVNSSDDEGPIDPMSNATVIRHEMSLEETIYSHLDIKITNLSESYFSTKVIFCVFLNDGEKELYIDNGLSQEQLTGKSYTEILNQN